MENDAARRPWTRIAHMDFLVWMNDAVVGLVARYGCWTWPRSWSLPVQHLSVPHNVPTFGNKMTHALITLFLQSFELLSVVHDFGSKVLDSFQRLLLLRGNRLAPGHGVVVIDGSGQRGERCGDLAWKGSPSESCQSNIRTITNDYKVRVSTL